MGLAVAILVWNVSLHGELNDFLGRFLRRLRAAVNALLLDERRGDAVLHFALIAAQTGFQQLTGSVWARSSNSSWVGRRSPISSNLRRLDQRRRFAEEEVIAPRAHNQQEEDSDDEKEPADIGKPWAGRG